MVAEVAAGLCGSVEHVPRGYRCRRAPAVRRGHEGGGIVRKVVPNVHGLEVGDHVITSFIPACGECRWCAMGMQNLCDNGALALLATFAEWQVYDQKSWVKIAADIPLPIECLVVRGADRVRVGPPRRQPAARRRGH